MLVWAMLKHEKSVSRNVSHKKKMPIYIYIYIYFFFFWKLISKLRIKTIIYPGTTTAGADHEQNGAMFSAVF